MSIGIIGCGAAGCILLLELAYRKYDLSNIVVVDPYFDGGALGRKWGAVRSNTKWKQITDCLELYPTCKGPIAELSATYQPTDIVLLSDLACLLRDSIRPLLHDVTIVAENCLRVQQTATGWRIECRQHTEDVTTLFLCQGGEPKTLDYGKPMIPLEIALDPILLARFVKPTHVVSVFGLAHSGTLILRNLQQIGATVNAFHDTVKPFYFARDGEYDGIKEEAAIIADAILANQYTKLKLFRSQDTKSVVKASLKADWIISSIGFSPKSIEVRSLDGARVNECDYSPSTGAIQDAVHLYGFGISYPGVSEVNGIVYKDVSIPSFVQQIRKCLSILFQ
jgi:hypothetical protein